MTELLTPVSYGELIDKLTILEIKAERITDAGKLANVQTERAALAAAWNAHPASTGDIADLRARLKQVNETLWVVEDDLRDCERAQDFGPRFIELARKVYFTNDERARLKKDINLRLGSRLVEEKSYADYSAGATRPASASAT